MAFDVINGSADPGSGIGANGDFYLNTSTFTIFGPKSGGVWPAGVSLVGPGGATGATGATGAAGATGATGAAGANGNTVRNGAGAPSGGVGVDGDFYLDTTAHRLYGPKTSGAWGSGVSLIGPAGADGAAGATGPTGPAGAAGGIASGTPVIALPDNYSTPYTGWANYSLYCRLSGAQLSNLAASWKIKGAFVGGSGYSINKAIVMRTAHGSQVVLDVTSILFGGAASKSESFGSTPSVASPFILTSDAIALLLDSDHDYWILFYFDADGGGLNGGMGTPRNSSPSGFVPMGTAPGDASVAAGGTMSLTLGMSLQTFFWSIVAA
jgi:hypothetical protein